MPKRPSIPEGTKIDATHPMYRSAASAAHRAGLSQEQFSELLGFEAERVASVHAAAPAPAAPPPPPAAPAPEKPREMTCI